MPRPPSAAGIPVRTLARLLGVVWAVFAASSAGRHHAAAAASLPASGPGAAAARPDDEERDHRLGGIGAGSSVATATGGSDASSSLCLAPCGGAAGALLVLRPAAGARFAVRARVPLDAVLSLPSRAAAPEEGGGSEGRHAPSPHSSSVNATE